MIQETAPCILFFAPRPFWSDLTSAAPGRSRENFLAVWEARFWLTCPHFGGSLLSLQDARSVGRDAARDRAAIEATDLHFVDVFVVIVRTTERGYFSGFETHTFWFLRGLTIDLRINVPKLWNCIPLLVCANKHISPSCERCKCSTFASALLPIIEYMYIYGISDMYILVSDPTMSNT